MLPKRAPRPNTRSTAQKGAALATAIALLAGLGALAPAVGAAAEPSEVTEGTLTWGIKESFRNYVGLDHVTLSGGASLTPANAFQFTPATGSYDPVTETTSLTFSGTLHFEQYCGYVKEFPDVCILDLTITDPQIVISPDAQLLTAEVVSHSMDLPTDAPPVDYGRIPLANLGLGSAVFEQEDGVASWSGVTASLHGDAVAAFAGFYARGTNLDLLSFSYAGEGGMPDTGESWTREGTPLYALDGVYASPTAASTTFTHLFVDGEVVHEWRSGTVVPLDAETMEPLRAPVTFSGANNNVVFDPETGSIIYLSGATVNRASWNSSTEAYQTEQIGALPPAASTTTALHGMTWNPYSHEVAIIAGDLAAYPLPTLFRFGVDEGGTWSAKPLVVLTDVAPGDYTPAGTRSIFGSSTLQSPRYLAALNKTSYIMTVRPLSGQQNPLHIAVLPDGESAVTQLDIPRPPLLDGASTGRTYEFATQGANGRVLLVMMSSASVPSILTLEDVEGVPVPTGPGYGTDAVRYSSAASAPPGDVDYVVDTQAQRVRLFDGSELVTEFTVPAIYNGVNSVNTGLAAGGDGTVYVQVRATVDGTARNAVERWAVSAVSPTVAEQPVDAVATQAPGGTFPDATFRASATGQPAPSIRWQVRAPGESTFDTIAGATGETLSVSPTADDNGNEYRAVFTNAAGAIASDVATLSLHTPPTILAAPASTSANVGGSASFLVMPGGNPHPEVTWQRFEGGSWTDLTAGGQFTIDGGFLTVSDIEAEQDGTRFRAKLSNEVGTIFTDEVTLLVVGAPDEDTTYTGVAFEWTGSAEWQHQPPNASTANYFSAGVSDGTEATYSASSAGVEIIQRDGSGGDLAATWATRGLHIDRGGSAAQLVRLTDGTAEVRADGSATIEWPGSFSVNFYDGLVPFTLRDLVLEVAVDGTGTLKADLAGYSGDMEHPDRPKEPVVPAAGVTVATFSSVVVDPERGFVVTPNYAGVQITVPLGATAQKRDVSGWGSWPQGFVDFQQTTGLAAYFYTTGGIFDANKTPSPFTVGFDGATIPAVAPTITAQPGSVSVAAGADASFSASASGYPTPTVQWQSKLAGAGDWVNVPGATATSYVARGVDKGASGTQYRAVFTNSEGTVITDAATLTVAAPPVVKPTATDAGYLSWGVRGSFRDYITGPIAKGSISLSGGASTSGGAFRFGQSDSSWSADTGTGTADYGGAVRFYGHSGVLDVTLSNPSITVNSASSATLYVSANGSRIAIGNVNLAAASKSGITGGVAYSGAPVTLTAAGASVFSYGSSQFYAPGTAMDSVTFVVGANSSGGGGSGTIAAFKADEWTPPATPPAATGIEADPAALADVRAGRELTVWADGFQPSEEGIKVVIYSEPILLETNLTADTSGRATWTGIIPAELEPGKHTLTFQGSVNRGIVLDVKAAQQLEGCTIEDATLSWGFKESFRAYIDGSIANGEWTVSDGATYSTPLFGWAKGTGVYDVDAASGQVDFTGSIRFTGHDGLLDTTVANPRLQFVDEKTAYLLLDVAGVTMEDALAGKTDPVVVTAVPFVKLDLSGGTVKLSEDGATLTGTDVPTAITAQGYEAFPKYEAGTAFDPVSFTVTVGSDCTTALPATGADQAPATDPVSDQGPDMAWVWWLIGALMLAAIIVAVVVLLRRRRLAEEGTGTHQG